MSISLHAASLDSGPGQRLTAFSWSVPVSFNDCIRAWQDDAEFRATFNAALATMPWPAVRWELPQLSATTKDRPFECVVLPAPELARAADGSDFASHFRGAPPDGVVRFANLGGDAELVVPCPDTSGEGHAHLADFVRHAPERQRDALWTMTGAAVAERLASGRRVWLNTAGDGVPWLHIRLDERPKYYQHLPYRQG